MKLPHKTFDSDKEEDWQSRRGSSSCKVGCCICWQGPFAQSSQPMLPTSVCGMRHRPPPASLSVLLCDLTSNRQISLPSPDPFSCAKATGSSVSSMTSIVDEIWCSLQSMPDHAAGRTSCSSGFGISLLSGSHQIMSGLSYLCDDIAKVDFLGGLVPYSLPACRQALVLL